MKNSIARKVTRQVALFLILALAVMLIVSFVLLRYFVSVKNKKFSQAVVTMYCDLLLYESDRRDIPLNGQNADIVNWAGDYFCKWYGIDCAFLGVPDEKANTIKYVGVSANKKNFDNSLKNHLENTIFDFDMPKSVRDVWNGKEVFAYAPVETIFGKEFCAFVRLEDSEGNKYLAGIDISYSDTYKQIATYFSLLAGIILLVVLCVYVGVYLTVKKKVSKPAEILSRGMNEFVAGGEVKHIYFPKKQYYEYTMIANAFNRMSENINEYIKNIDTLSREKERHSAELTIASGIQQGFLPDDHKIEKKYEIRGVMTPAKDIGGDLYDYVKIDDNHILIAVADVSGKGITASIFMAFMLTLIRQFAKLNLSPDKILEQTNETIYENNSSLLFATAFIGIFDCEKNIFTYSNAGHNHPFIVGKTVTELNKATGTLLGLFKDEKYETATVNLNAGDTVFLYTDGVTEAINGENEFFGEKRLISVLKDFKASKSENLISFVNGSVKDFVKDAEQYDDITMLTLTAKSTTRLELDFKIEEFIKIKELILNLPLSRDKQLNLCLAAEECFVNICSYAFEGTSPDGEKIEFTLSVSDRINLIFKDSGMEFNPIEEVKVPEDYDLDTKIGGLGKLIAVSCVDDIKYEYKEGKNILTLTKFFEEDI